MTIATDLDGKYTVVSHSTQDSPQSTHSDGFTVIKDGRTMRLDGAGCQWQSHFEWVGPDKVKMTSVVDTTYAEEGFTLTGADGRPTTEAQCYEAVLDVKNKDSLPVISGFIPMGEQKIHLTLRKVAPAG